MSSSKTLDAIKGLPAEEVERRLASAIQVLLPKPEEAAIDDNTRELLNQTREKLSRGKQDETAESRRIFEYLFDQLKDVVVEDEGRVRARLGQRGELPPYLYRAEFEPSFRDAVKRGIRRAHVEAALARPDAVQHVQPPVMDPGSFPSISLYAKYQNGNHFNTHALIVETERRGATQHVGTAWRIYPSEVDVAKAESPLDILHAFVNTYGLEFRVGEGEKRKWVYYQTFTVPRGQEKTQILKFEAPKGVHHVTGRFIVATNKDSGRVEVALAYSIDLSRYGADLRRHGVRTEL